MADPNLRKLPSVAKLLDSPELSALPHHCAVAGARKALEEARETQNGAPDFDKILDRAVELACAESLSAYRPAINCSGTILNTGLGRARLAGAAVKAMTDAARSHAILELDLETGKRGDRQSALSNLLCELTGAEAACVVNNNAAAVMLAVNTFARGKSVLLSRGQSVEIGGSFRMPDVVCAAGARLIDVGCTNKTRVSDYVNGREEDTTLILRCHPSNFVILGFSEEPTISELAQTAREVGLRLLDDVGSGCLVNTEAFGLPHEPTIKESLKAGADIVTASGDKLLGGPQAGIICGKQDLVSQIRKNPLARAVRIDKLTAAALEATLRLYLNGEESQIPTIKYLSRTTDEVSAIANDLQKLLAKSKIKSEVAEGICEPGGGSLPGVSLQSHRVRLQTEKPDELSKKLRTGATPVIGYIEKGSFWLDMRTVEADELPIIESAIRDAVRN